MSAPLLVFGWGNPSRGDDALGPLFVERLRAMTGLDGRVDCLDDYQLQVEHVFDLAGREQVLFVDASLDCAAPFEVGPLRPGRDASISTHAVSPQGLLQVYREVQGCEPPPSTLLAIRGECFELGAAPSASALAGLDAAVAWALCWLAQRLCQVNAGRDAMSEDGG